ncbi:PRC-barrel domain-containing protein [Oceanibaculum pacificum]|uniref:PRC-barrel domain-containing protein n=1 Tax=Oceanibaculum pacificum TaxID=580166 RepID=A0A154W391_9PROT|nr:PRC-barrel domain-containing protein [Oceanibaculum pacificum]KZD07927.1 hypothetical protein AUP43_09460 [Oceanibaculum pacificum]
MRKDLIATVSAIALAAPLLLATAPASAQSAGVSGSATTQTDTGATTGGIGDTVRGIGKDIGAAVDSAVNAGKDVVAGTGGLTNTLIGKAVTTTDGKQVGKVKDVVTGEGGTQVQQVIIGSGGVLGLGEKQIAIPAEKVTSNEVDGTVKVDMTEAEFKTTLENAVALGTAGDVKAAGKEVSGFSTDLTAIVGKSVQSTDGKKVGEVKDVVLGADGKAIQEVVIGTGGLLGLGEKKLTLPPSEIRMDEQAKAIVVGMTEAEFKKAVEAEVSVVR